MHAQLTRSQFLEAESQGTGPAAAQDPEQRNNAIDTRDLMHAQLTWSQFLEAESQGTGPAAAQDPEQRNKIMKRLSDIHLQTVGVLDKVQRGGSRGVCLLAVCSSCQPHLTLLWVPLFIVQVHPMLTLTAFSGELTAPTSKPKTAAEWGRSTSSKRK